MYGYIKQHDEKEQQDIIYLLDIEIFKRMRRFLGLDQEDCIEVIGAELVGGISYRFTMENGITFLMPGDGFVSIILMPKKSEDVPNIGSISTEIMIHLFEQGDGFTTSSIELADTMQTRHGVEKDTEQILNLVKWLVNEGYIEFAKDNKNELWLTTAGKELGRVLSEGRKKGSPVPPPKKEDVACANCGTTENIAEDGRDGVGTPICHGCIPLREKALEDIEKSRKQENKNLCGKHQVPMLIHRPGKQDALIYCPECCEKEGHGKHPTAPGDIITLDGYYELTKKNPMHFRTEPSYWEIRNVNNNTAWDNTHGWVEDDDYTLFTDEEKESMDLPLEGRWVRTGPVKEHGKKQPCEACSDNGWLDTLSKGKMEIQRCDLCQKFESDHDALQAYLRQTIPEQQAEIKELAKPKDIDMTASPKDEDGFSKVTVKSTGRMMVNESDLNEAIEQAEKKFDQTPEEKHNAIVTILNEYKERDDPPETLVAIGENSGYLAREVVQVIMKEWPEIMPSELLTGPNCYACTYPLENPKKSCPACGATDHMPLEDTVFNPFPEDPNFSRVLDYSKEKEDLPGAIMRIANTLDEPFQRADILQELQKESRWSETSLEDVNKTVSELVNEEAQLFHDGVGFYVTVREELTKPPDNGPSEKELELDKELEDKCGHGNPVDDCSQCSKEPEEQSLSDMADQF